MSRIAWWCGLGLIAAVVPARADVLSARPADATPVAAASPPTGVYLTPFHPLTDAPDWAWVGRAVEHNLSVDLMRSSCRTTAADTDADPLAAARAAGARYAVVGTYQWVDPKLRLDAQVSDVATGNVIGVLSATGDGRDLFALEDDLSAQLARTLARAPGHSVHAATTRPIPPALQPEALAAMVAPPAAGVGSAYAGSALQSYVDNNRSPAVDYDQQLANVRQQNTFASYNNYGGPDGQGYAFGGYGYGFGYGSAYGGGGYLPGVSYPIAGGSFGYGGYGGGFGGGFGGGGYRGTFAGGRGSISVGVGSRGGYAGGGRGGFR